MNLEFLGASKNNIWHVPMKIIKVLFKYINIDKCIWAKMQK